MKHNLRLSILCVLVIFFLNSTAQVTQLSNNTNLEQGIALGNIGVMLSASDSFWKTDGSAAGTMKYLNNVSDTSHIWAVLNNKIYFAGIDAANGEELWVTDGITASIVTNIETGNGSSSPREFTVFNNTLYFFATTAADGTELWKSDGTTTTMVKNINPTGSSYNIKTTFFENNNILYFVADNGADGTELWKTDGTGPNTVIVSNINPTGSSDPSGFIALGNDVIFSATNGTDGVELWKTDGTTTSMVKNIVTVPTVGSNPSQFILFDGKIYFTTIDALGGGFGLWVTDGTAPNTTEVKAFDGFVFLSFAVFMNNKFYFTATTTAEGAELWYSDGTPANTQIFIDIILGPGSSGAFLLPDILGATSAQSFHGSLYNGKIFFTADNGTDGVELWITDGTAPNTMMIENINPTGDGLADLTAFLYSQSGIYFTATNGTDGYEPYFSNGTSLGTDRVIDLNPGPGDSEAEFMMLLNNQLLFTADDGDNVNGDRDLYKLDGIFTPLPLQLLNFAAAQSGKSVLLNWVTGTEINTSHFEIERSKDGKQFDKIGGVNAINIQQKNTYRFNDADALLLGVDNLFYRLKLFDKDGKFTYSKVEVVNVKAGKVSFYSYPNPAHLQLTVLVNSAHEQRGTLKITDVNGRQLYSRQVKNLKGANQHNINIASYPNGIYYLQIISAEGKQLMKFIKE